MSVLSSIIQQQLKTTIDTSKIAMLQKDVWIQKALDEIKGDGSMQGKSDYVNKTDYYIDVQPINLIEYIL